MTNDIKADESILIDYNLNYNPDGVSFGSNCYFQQPDGSHVAETVSIASTASKNDTKILC